MVEKDTDFKVIKASYPFLVTEQQSIHSYPLIKLCLATAN